MGLIGDILGEILGNGQTGSSDPKPTRVENNDQEVRVRNSDVVVNHTTGRHDTIWSNTSVNLNTGEVKVSEGTHGPNYQK